MPYFTSAQVTGRPSCHDRTGPQHERPRPPAVTGGPGVTREVGDQGPLLVAGGPRRERRQRPAEQAVDDGHVRGAVDPLRVPREDRALVEHVQRATALGGTGRPDSLALPPARAAGSQPQHHGDGAAGQDGRPQHADPLVAVIPGAISLAPGPLDDHSLLGEVAGDPVARRQLDRQRHLCGAPVLRLRAPGAEDAARRRVLRAGQVALSRIRSRPRSWSGSGHRHSRQEGVGVGVQRPLVERVAVGAPP